MNKSFVDAEYLRVAGDLLAAVKQRSYVLMDLPDPADVIDIGCGPGSDTMPLADLVGAGGQVHGVDADPEMISLANTRARERDISNITYQVADALDLPFDEATFDASRCERLFQHLREPARALTEMIRVTKPGGRVVVVDTDWGALSCDSLEDDIERRLARVRTEHVLRNGYSGRQLHRLLVSSGLHDVHLEVMPVWSTNYQVARAMTFLDETEQLALQQGVVAPNELERWQTGLDAASANGTFFVSVSVVLAVGVRQPGRQEALLV